MTATARAPTASSSHASHPAPPDEPAHRSTASTMGSQPKAKIADGTMAATSSVSMACSWTRVPFSATRPASRNGYADSATGVPKRTCGPPAAASSSLTTVSASPAASRTNA